MLARSCQKVRKTYQACYKVVLKITLTQTCCDKTVIKLATQGIAVWLYHDCICLVKTISLAVISLVASC